MPSRIGVRPLNWRLREAAETVSASGVLSGRGLSEAPWTVHTGPGMKKGKGDSKAKIDYERCGFRDGMEDG